MKSNSEKQTAKVAQALAHTLKGHETIFLHGDVGAGKTIFAKALAKTLGITDTVTSPTFSYFNIYEGGKHTLYHFDLYRISQKEHIQELGLTEYLFSEGIKLVEWADLLDITPDISVQIKKIDQNSREITIEHIIH